MEAKVVTGLANQSLKNGEQAWRYRYSFAGKQRQISLGLKAHVSETQAQAMARQAQTFIHYGIDPKSRRLAITRGYTTCFCLVALEWLEDGQPNWTDKYYKRNLTVLKQHVFPDVGDVPVDVLIGSDFMSVLKAVKAESGKGVALYVQSVCRQVMDHAKRTCLIERNPLLGVSVGQRDKAVHRPSITNPNEARAMVKAVWHHPPTRSQLRPLAMRLLILTALRPVELVTLRWSDWDRERKRLLIPAQRMKRDRDHYVPLSRQAVLVLDLLHRQRHPDNDLCFPGLRNHRQPMSTQTLLNGFKAVGYGPGQFTSHGCRAMFYTLCREELKANETVLDLCLAHCRKNPMGETYDRSELLAERARVMQSWADWITRQV